MKKYWIIIVILICIIIFQDFYYKPSAVYIQESKIDSLQVEIDSLSKIKNKTIVQIDTIYKELNIINKEYEKNFNTIINNNPSEDVSFFLNYIQLNKPRLDSIKSGY